MVGQGLQREFVFFSTSLLVLTTCALQINHTGEVVYRDSSVYGVVDKAVVLECGATLPDLFIWSFTKPGTDAIKAVLYDLGKGPKIQKLANMVGPLTILPSTASIRIEKLPLAAHGLFTCQAFYDVQNEPIVYYYYVHLTVQVPVSKPYLVMSETFPVEGSALWMNCSVENGSEPIQYKWHHEAAGENIWNISQYNSSIVSVTSVSRNYTGWYHCEVSNAVNNETSDRLLVNVTFGPDEPQIDVTPYHITKHGYSALENRTVSMHCHSRSNPSSQYIWLYNNSQIYTRPLLTIDKILRTHTGNYTCLAQNSHLHTQSSKSLSLTVYYPPDGSPVCSVEPALNHTALRLLCSWFGGFPSPSLNWTRVPIQAAQKQANTPQLTSNVLMLSSDSLNVNSSSFTCVGSHSALQQPTECSTHSHIPPAEPMCFFNVSGDKQYLMLSCSWDGGVPKSLVWWEGSGNQSKDEQENANIMVLRYGTAQSGKPYICYAKHPLLGTAKTCGITLVSISKPYLLMSDSSPKERSTIWMHCSIENGTRPIHHVWQHQLYNGTFTTFTQGSSSIINITDIVRNQTGWYRCTAGNAVNSQTSEKMWLNVTFGPDVPQIDVAPSSVVQRGYTALENETVTLTCRAQSNPASQYVWLHNDSEVHSGSQLTIMTILRVHSGDYTCVGQNSFLNTRSRKTITLTVYYPPNGSPFCSVEPALNHTTLRLLCSWPGGFPSSSLHWTGDLIPAGQQLVNKEQTNLLSLNLSLPSGGLTPNSSLFTCHGSHPALKQQTKCSTLTYAPPAEPVCTASVTDDKQVLILSCSWGGGFPKAYLWWKGPGGQGKDGEESSNILTVRYNTFQFGKPYTCYAKHPLLVQTKSCGLTLVPVSKPSLLIRDASTVEGSTVGMQCNVENGTEPIQFAWQREIQRGNITTLVQGSNSNIFTMTNVNRSHSGRYRCVGSNFINTESSDWVFLDVIFGPDVPQIDVTSYSITDRGYSALETEPVSLSCQAQSNPASQYIWFYNNSQVYIGPQYTIAKILRVQTGDYTCLAQNSQRNTRSRKTISLIVYYAPVGSPSCSLEPAQNHTSLRILCSWSGGFPSPALRWTGDVIKAGLEQEETGLQNNLQTSAAILLPSEGRIPNNSLFTCIGSHPVRKQQAECSTRAYIPTAEPVCFAYVTNNQQYLMLSCSWDGGAPKALVWWEGPGGQSKGGQENSNILVLRYGTARSGNPYTCYAKHPLLMETKSCRLTLEAPVLLTQRRVVSVYEGSDVQLTCNLRANYLPTNEITWFNNQGVDVQDTSKYMLLRTSAWANLTVRETDWMQDSGEYRCSTSNAVGGAEINVTLVVKKYPMPPNATLIRVAYISRQRNEVELEWQVDGAEETGGWTGFYLEHQWVSERPNKRGSTNISQVRTEERISPQEWYRTTIQDPGVRSHTVRDLTPTVTYQFRIIPINHRTMGHPSVARTPVEVHDNVYPAVVGAAVGGMLFAAIPTVLLLVYIIRNRDNNPRLHAMLFGSKHSQSRENINFPEDEVAAGSDGGLENTTGLPSPGTTVAEPKA